VVEVQVDCAGLTTTWLTVDDPAGTLRNSPSATHEAFDIPEWRCLGSQRDLAGLEFTRCANGPFEVGGVGFPAGGRGRGKPSSLVLLEVDFPGDVEESVGVREPIVFLEQEVEGRVGNRCRQQCEEEGEKESGASVALTEECDGSGQALLVHHAGLASNPVRGAGGHPGEGDDDFAFAFPFLVV
jgi:hypothetical protein